MAQGSIIINFSISYFLFFILLWQAKLKKGNRILDKDGNTGNQQIIISLHTGGIFLLGILPAFLFNHFFETTFGTGSITDSLCIECISFFTIAFIILAPGIADRNKSVIPGKYAGGALFSSTFIISYFLVRLLFLCAYESWFRGYLLSACINNFGIPSAIIINIGLYTLLHIVNGKDEVLICIPFGLLLCGLCIWQGAAWPAMILHIAFALPYEIQLLTTINKPSNTFT